MGFNSAFKGLSNTVEQSARSSRNYTPFMKAASSTTFSEQITVGQSLKADEASVHLRSLFIVLRSCSVLFFNLSLRLLNSVAARSKAWVCGRSLPGIGGSNPFRDMDVCLLWVLCVVR